MQRQTDLDHEQTINKAIAILENEIVNIEERKDMTLVERSQKKQEF